VKFNIFFLTNQNRINIFLFSKILNIFGFENISFINY